MGLTAALMAGCSGDTVAMVNNTPITTAALQQRAAQLAHGRDLIALRSRQAEATLRARALEALVDQTLVLEAAATAAPMSRTTLDRAVNELFGTYPRKAFQDMLASRRQDEAAWRDEQRRKIHVAHYIERIIAPTITVPDQAVAAYYQEHQQTFFQPDAVQARQILVSDPQTAQQIREQLLQGANFAQLAMEHSISPEASAGGDLGWMDRGSFPTIFEDVCFRLPVGAVSRVVHSDYGHHIFKVLARRRRHQQPLAQMAETIRTGLMAQATETAFRAHVKELRAGATLTMKRDAIDRVTLSFLNDTENP
jgi:parvulin-like peptidyl-prolyl isomerase